MLIHWIRQKIHTCPKIKQNFLYFWITNHTWNSRTTWIFELRRSIVLNDCTNLFSQKCLPMYIKLTLNIVHKSFKNLAYDGICFMASKRGMFTLTCLSSSRISKFWFTFWGEINLWGKGVGIGHLSISLDLDSRTSSLLFILEDSSCVLLLGISFSMIFPLWRVVTDLT